MAGSLDAAALRRLARMGVQPLSADDGLALFDTAVGSQDPVLVAARLVAARTAVRRASAADALAGRLAGLEPGERATALADLVRGQAAAVLGFDGAAAIEPRRQFQELGFDSLTAVEYRNKLSTATGLRLPVTVIFDYPTPAELTDYLVARFGETEDEEAAVLRLFADLDRIEKTVAALDPRNTARERFGMRLREVLSSLSGLDGRDSAARIQEASDEEMFALIDDTLEAS
jgi:acyl carrier protein